MTAALTRRRLVAAAMALPPATALGWLTVAAAPTGIILVLAAVGRLALTRGVMTAEASAPAELAAILESNSGSGSLRNAIAADFARGAVVHLDGWVLSVTEVRVCVSAYLGSVAAA